MARTRAATGQQRHRLAKPGPPAGAGQREQQLFRNPLQMQPGSNATQELTPILDVILGETPKQDEGISAMIERALNRRKNRGRRVR